MAASVFRLRASATQEDELRDAFEVAGYESNPFPEPGLGTGALYTGHMQAEVGRLEGWVSDVEAATAPSRMPGGPVRPLALRGSIGVGKTHLLKALEERIQRRGTLAVSRRTLPEEGMARLLLSTLLLNCLPQGDDEVELPPLPSSLPLLDRIVLMSKKADRRPRVLETLDRLRDSVVAQAISRILQESDFDAQADLRSWFARWMLRAHTTPGQRNRLGLAKPLEGEGQAIRAVADLIQLARAAGQVQAWFVLLDQLEDLWRAGVITPGRRARFLTDLRLLADLGLEGAPIAVLLAWNTEISAKEDKLEIEYQALWRRLGEPIDLPGLEPNDVWPFAKEYLSHAARRKGPIAKERRENFRRKLEQYQGEIIQALRRDEKARLGPQRFAPYRVLHHWREVAVQLANQTELE